MADYIAPADVMAALAIAETDDPTLNQAVSAASNLVRDMCGRDFGTVASSARFFHPLDGYCCPIDDATTVTVVATDDAGDGLYSTIWAAADWQATPVGNIGPAGQTGWPYTAIVAIESRSFTTDLNLRPTVKVTAVWGWGAIPAPIKQATLFVASEMFKAAREAPFGSANLADFGPVLIRGNRRVDQLLAPYKTMAASDGRFLVA